MIILYTIGCPKCKILEKKLHDKNIEYETVTNRDVMLEMELDSLPVLEVDGNLMNFGDAVRWVNNQ